MAKAKSKTGKTWTYVLVRERELPVEEQSVWTLGQLPQRALTELSDSTEVDVDENGEVRTMIRLGTQHSISLRHGIVDVTNFMDDDATPPVELHPRPNKELVTPITFIERIEHRDQQELAVEIMKNGGPLSRKEVEK